MGVIKYVPIGPGRYRRIFRKKRKTDTLRRKPLGPPIASMSVASVMPFQRLPAEFRRLCGQDRASGERDDG